MEHPFEPLGGTWAGEGAGEYPTIEPFRYHEQLAITPVQGRPVAVWVSRTTDLASGEPRHAEAGFLRAVDGGVELVVSHGFGVAEVATGPAFTGDRLDLDSVAIAGSPTAKRVDRVERRYVVAGDRLTYRIAMAAVGVGLTHHLAAQLDRT